MERKRDFSWLKNWRTLTLCVGCVFAGFLVGMLIFGSPWHLPPAWGDIPTWITAIATVGLFVGAIFTAAYAIKAFRAQSQEVTDQAKMLKVQSEQLEEQRKINAEQTKVLQLQASELRESLDERRHEAEIRHRAQASQVFISLATPDRRHARFNVANTSEQPVYDTEIRWRYMTADTPVTKHIPLGTIMPGDRHSIEAKPGRHAESVRPDPDADFTALIFIDAAGAMWTRKLDGNLRELATADPDQRTPGDE